MLVRTGEKKTLVQCWWECKLVQSQWKTVCRLLSNLKKRIIIWSSNPTSGYISKENGITISKRYLHPRVYCSIIYNNQDMCNLNVIDIWIDRESVVYMGFPWWLSGKESPFQCRAAVQMVTKSQTRLSDKAQPMLETYFDSRSGRSPTEGNGNPLQYSCLGNPMDRGV